VSLAIPPFAASLAEAKEVSMAVSPRRSAGIPGPGALPVIGQRGNLMQFFRDPVAAMSRLQREYGSVAALVGGDPRMVLAFGAAHNQHILGGSDTIVQSLTASAPSSSAVWRLGQGLLSLNHDQHRQHRRLIAPAFHKQQLGVYWEHMVACTQQALATWPVGTPFDVEQALQRLTLRVVSKVLFGLDITTDGRSIGERVKQLLQMLFSPALLLFPFDLPGSPYRRLHAFAAQLEAAIVALIAEKRANPDAQHDVLATLIHSHDEDGTRLTDAQLIGHANLLFLAGYDTSANALSWTLFLLAQHPPVMAAVLDELGRVLGGAAPTLEQLTQLPLLERVIKESMRILPPVVFTQRTSAHAFELGGYAIPAGAAITVSMYVTHHLPDIYPDPERFDPDRWLTAEPSAYGYMPFGGGPHVCLGAAFAMMEIKIVLALVLQRFRLVPQRNARIDRRVQVTLSTRNGMPMIATPQDGTVMGSRVPVRGNIHEMVTLD
jgi:cytochrome P450